MKRIADYYIEYAGVIGALYCIVPCIIIFAVGTGLGPFKAVYFIRLALSLVIGGYVGARLNRLGVEAWLIKHHSSKGPATIADGIEIGWTVGIGTFLLPPLTFLIMAHDYRHAVLLIASIWMAGALIGALIGGALAAVCRESIPAGPQVEGRA
jgi:hypothetical protein